jgi:tetratricopeptide (TPR) repeat protein/TolB-like protein
VRRRVAVLVWLLAAFAAVPAAAQPDAVLVVPFELERFDPRVGWLAEGVAVGVTRALDIRGVAVVTRDERLAALERLQLPPAAALTRATLIKVAELVGAGRVVLGTVREAEGTVTIVARRLDVDEARLVELPVVSSPASRLFEAFTRLVEHLDAPPATTDSRAAVIAPSVPAFELYVRGLVATAPDQQEKPLAQALTLAPDYEDARKALWSAQTTRGAHDQALATAGGVSGTRVPGAGSPEWRLRAASSLVQLRRYDDAFAQLTALAAVSRETAVSSLLGVVQLRRGSTPQTGRATYYFNQAVERDAASADACFNLGYAYWLDKDALAAAYWLREAVRRDPTDGDAHFVLAAALAASGAGPESERERELARRLSERWESAGAGEVVPRGLERLPEYSRPASRGLESTLNAGVQRDQRALAAFHLDTATRAFEAGRDQETIRETQRALYLTPYDVDGLRLLGRAQARSGLLQDAIGALKIAIWSQESAAAQVELGELLLRARDAAGALRAAERALVLEPGHAGAADLATRARASRGGA